MIQDKKDTAGSIVWALRHLWRYRKGHKPIGRLQDALEGLGLKTKTGLRPLLCHEHKTDTGWHLVLHLPPGISSHDIESKLHHLEEQTGGDIEIRVDGEKLHMDIYLMPLPQAIDFPDTPIPTEDNGVTIPLGVSRQGPLDIELSDKPHMLVGGNTGAGKSTALRVMVLSALMGGAEVIIIDLKGGLDFSVFRRHCNIVTTDDGALDIMRRLQKESQRRLPKLEAVLAASRREYKGDDMPYIVLIIDEVAELESKESQQALNRLVRLSRSSGICVVCATQRPSSSIFTSTVFSNTRMLFGGRLCFAVPKAEDSKMVLDDDSASRLPPYLKGRAIWQWGKRTEVQCYNLTLEHALHLVESVPVKEGSFHEHRPKKLDPGS